MMRDLIERLRMMYSHRGDGIPTQYCNPNGPEAADCIEALTARAEKAEARVKATEAVLQRMTERRDGWKEARKNKSPHWSRETMLSHETEIELAALWLSEALQDSGD